METRQSWAKLFNRYNSAKPIKPKNEKTSHFIDLVKTHGHLLISGEFQNVKSNVVIYFNEHQSEYTTTFGN